MIQPVSNVNVSDGAARASDDAVNESASPVVESAPIVSVVFVSFRTRELTLASIDAVIASLREDPIECEIILVENAGGDGTVHAVVERFPDVRVVDLDENVGFGRGNNRGARIARGDLLFFLNTDTEIRPGSIQAMVRRLDREPGWGALGARLVNPDGSAQPSILTLPTVWRIFCEFFWLDRLGIRRFAGPYDSRVDPSKPGVIEAANGAALMVRRELFERIGGFDPDFFMYYEECDLCRRIRREGAEVGYEPEAVVMHHVGASSSDRPWWFFRIMRSSRRIYGRKHFNRLERVVVDAIVSIGYLMRIILFSIVGIVNPRLRRLGRTMFLSYVKPNRQSDTRRSRPDSTPAND